jgi:hypothetical protein
MSYDNIGIHKRHIGISPNNMPLFHISVNNWYLYTSLLKIRLNRRRTIDMYVDVFNHTQHIHFLNIQLLMNIWNLLL